MAQTIPIYINVDTITSASLVDDTPVGGAITTNSGPIASGLVWGVHGELSSTAGTVTVSVYNDAAGTRELYSVTLDFGGGVTQSSDMMTSGIPVFEAPYYTATGDSTSAGKTIDLTFYVSAMTY